MGNRVSLRVPVLLWLAKSLSAFEINNLIIAMHRQPAIVPSHVRNHGTLAGLDLSLLLHASESLARKPGSSAATRGSEAQTTQTTISRARLAMGRRKISKEIRDLIFLMVAETPTWGAPRIHGELLMLGFAVSERTVSRWMPQAPRDSEPARCWLSFLHNHREAIAAMDFFTVPTIAFSVLYCFFIIRHDRRRILHFNVTQHPTSTWIVQQLREAFPYQWAPKFLIFDRDAKFGAEVPRAVRWMAMNPVLSEPWQNGIAERWVGSCRRDLLDHVIAVNERHLKRVLSEYVCYHHELISDWTRKHRRAEPAR